MKSIQPELKQNQMLNQFLLESKVVGNQLSSCVRECSSMKQVFELLHNPSVQHMAVLTPFEEPIANTFEFLSDSLEKNQSVTLAILHDGDLDEDWGVN